MGMAEVKLDGIDEAIREWGKLPQQVEAAHAYAGRIAAAAAFNDAQKMITRETGISRRNLMFARRLFTRYIRETLEVYVWIGFNPYGAGLSRTVKRGPYVKIAFPDGFPEEVTERLIKTVTGVYEREFVKDLRRRAILG